MMIKLPLTFLALAAALLLLPTLSSAEDDTGLAKPTLVMIHANWCGTCERIEETWETLKTTYRESANFVVFDVTDKTALQKSRTEAKRLGLTTILDEFKASTGTIAVVSAEGETLNVFRGVSDPTRYEGAIGLACTS